MDEMETLNILHQVEQGRGIGVKQQSEIKVMGVMQKYDGQRKPTEDLKERQLSRPFQETRSALQMNFKYSLI